MIDINDAIEIIFKEWSISNIDKSIYYKKAEKDKHRFEIQIKEFESLGYYIIYELSNSLINISKLLSFMRRSFILLNYW